ncbi:MAG: HD domain-containing protein [Candidatus Verstraetearchaeota archaeon]|nr:HD domain-containing protein [Candidatus Verstraetearchaeota archaeon]
MWKKCAEIRDPIHGYIFINELEREIIDTATFQRLRRIKQLGGAYLTYPGAEHTRFSHSIGTMHLAGALGEHLLRNGIIEEEDVQCLRLAALLHDLGHGPFSHVYEDISIKYLNKNHEDITTWLIKESEIGEILKKFGYKPEDIANLARGRRVKEKDFLDQVISSPFDVDKMDFLVRDSHFTGVQYGLIDIFRLIYSMNVVDGNLAVEVPGALYALEAFLIARYEMFKAVYYHRTVRSANIMISKAMELAREYLELTDFKTPEEYLKLDDAYVLVKIRELRNEKNKNLQMACKLINMLEKRELLKCAYEVTVHTRDKLMASLLSKETVRREIEREIAEKAGVNEESVLIDVPTLPSIPYSPRQIDPMEVFVFEEINGKRRIHRMSEISGIVNVLKGYFDVVRAYTFQEEREKVKKAAREVLGEGPISTKISF